MLQYVLAAALFAALPEPPTDQQVLSALPTSATGVSITKTLESGTYGTVWACVAFFVEEVDGQRYPRTQTVYLPDRR